MIKHALFIVFLSFSCVNAFADWTVDNEQSLVSFVSVKQINVVEAHHFTRLAGSLSDDGAFSLTIDLASVDTDISLRDQRMEVELFKQYKFPNATFSAAIAPSVLADLEVNKTTSLSLKGTLDLHGNQQSVTLLLSVTKLSNASLLVASKKPVILDASDFDLIKGINKLKSLAGLSNITTSVPVSFVLRLIP